MIIIMNMIKSNFRVEAKKPVHPFIYIYKSYLHGIVLANTNI